ncbi:hypothetical protein J6590_033242 [Homalodisca vitripennis]|nr:hypothetical protein J6590_033242 [Homalodisca vitripennis]
MVLETVGEWSKLNNLEGGRVSYYIRPCTQRACLRRAICCVTEGTGINMLWGRPITPSVEVSRVGRRVRMNLLKPRLGSGIIRCVRRHSFTSFRDPECGRGGHQNNKPDNNLCRKRNVCICRVSVKGEGWALLLTRRGRGKVDKGRAWRGILPPPCVISQLFRSLPFASASVASRISE